MFLVQGPSTGVPQDGGAEVLRLRHNEQGKGSHLLDDAKIVLVSGNDRRTDLTTGKGNQAIVHEAEAGAGVESLAVLIDLLAKLGIGVRLVVVPSRKRLRVA